jgi:hypothetical protein
VHTQCTHWHHNWRLQIAWWPEHSTNQEKTTGKCKVPPDPYEAGSGPQPQQLKNWLLAGITAAEELESVAAGTGSTAGWAYC